MPSDVNRYFEPFLGSGAIYLACASDKPAALSDVIGPLVNCYLQVRDCPEKVAGAAQLWRVNAETYYKVRDESFEDPVTQAAQFIYLNKTCFNGLYRENQQGQFNVPFGRPKTSNILDAQHLLDVSHKLRTIGTTIAVRDFEEALEPCEGGDIAYLDPPYVAGHRQNGFVDYNAKLFSWGDQRRLASLCHELDRRGAGVIMSNADHASVRELYSGSRFDFMNVSRYSSMAARSGKRGASDELLIVSKSLSKRADL